MLTTLQNRIKTLLAAHSWWEGLTVLTEEDGDIIYDIESAVQSVNGQVVTAVIIPAGNPGDRRSPHNVALGLTVTVNLAELFLLNESGKHARDGIAPVIQALHGQWSGLGSSNVRGASANLLFFETFEQVPDPGGLTVYQVRFATDINLPTSQIQ